MQRTQTPGAQKRRLDEPHSTGKVDPGRTLERTLNALDRMEAEIKDLKHKNASLAAESTVLRNMEDYTTWPKFQRDQRKRVGAFIRTMIERHRSIKKAAQACGMDRSQMNRFKREFEIEVPHI